MSELTTSLYHKVVSIAGFIITIFSIYHFSVKKIIHLIAYLITNKKRVIEIFEFIEAEEDTLREIIKDYHKKL